LAARFRFAAAAPFLPSAVLVFFGNLEIVFFAFAAAAAFLMFFFAAVRCADVAMTDPLLGLFASVSVTGAHRECAKSGGF
jgi:hypothetical protein